LPDQDYSRAVASVLKQLREVAGHGSDVLRYQNTTFRSRKVEYFRIVFSLESCGSCGLKIHRWLAAKTAGYDVLRQAGVREKPNHGSRRLGTPLRASRREFRIDSGAGWEASNADQARSASRTEMSTSAWCPR